MIDRRQQHCGIASALSGPVPFAHISCTSVVRTLPGVKVGSGTTACASATLLASSATIKVTLRGKFIALAPQPLPGGPSAGGITTGGGLVTGAGGPVMRSEWVGSPW